MLRYPDLPFLQILDAIHSGELANAEYEIYDVFNLSVPKKCTNVPDDLLNPKKGWKGTTDFKDEVTKLGELFNEVSHAPRRSKETSCPSERMLTVSKNFKKYADEATKEVLEAGPKTN